MGIASRKGESFKWILDHLRDGNGQVTPRSLILLVENAAILELNDMHATGAQVLSAIALRNALDKVSKFHFTQAVSEFRWLPALKKRLAPIRQLPWESRRALETALSVRWNE